MSGQGRLGDKANVPLDAHGCPACPHPAIGPAIQGSPDVNVNRRPALRVDDPGIHTACCGTNTWIATKGSLTVFINGKGAHRVGDENRHCGGMGQLVEGSPNVIIDDTSAASPNLQHNATRTVAATSGSASAMTVRAASPSGNAASRGPVSPANPGTASSASASSSSRTADASRADTPSITGIPSRDAPGAGAQDPASPSDSIEPEIDPDPAKLHIRAQVDVLRAAARAHVPFCEQCERAKMARLP